MTDTDLPKPIDWATFWDAPPDPDAKARSKGSRSDTSLFDTPCKGHEVRGWHCASRDCINRKRRHPQHVIADQDVALDDLGTLIGQWAGYGSDYAADTEQALAAGFTVLFDLVATDIDAIEKRGVNFAQEDGEMVLVGAELAEVVLDIIAAAGYVILPVEVFGGCDA